MSEQVITSMDNSLVKDLVKLRTSAKSRREKKQLLLVGRKLCDEAIDPLLIVVSDPSITDLPCKIVAPHVMKKITGLEAPDGIAAVVAVPEWKQPSQFSRLLILDGVADPGNMGTLLRTALALGWDGAFLVGDCCDPFNDKALRASRGAPLRLPTWTLTWDEAEQHLKGLTKIVADVTGEGPKGLSGPMALILGNEGHGPSPQALKNARKVSIPMSGKMESLNVSIAGGILMHLMGGDCG